MTPWLDRLDRCAVENRLVTMRKSVGQLSETPDSAAAAFRAAERAGVISAGLAAALTPPDGPHHVLVQLYLDTEPERVAGVVSAAAAGYREYIRQAAAWTAASARQAPRSRA